MKFDNATFEELSAKEWLVTNGLGGYASSSLSSANTRRYHGLLVAALNPPTGRTVMVSKIEESLISSEGSVIELSANRYPGTIHPTGFQYLKGFERLPIPTFQYEANGQSLTKSVFMPDSSNTTVIGYENSGTTTYRLQLRPLFVHRDYHSLISENAALNYRTEWKDNHVAVIYAYQNAPALYFSFTKGEFIEQRSWYKNFEYQKEQYRGLDFREDCLSLGYIDVDLLPGESIYLTFTLEEEFTTVDPLKLREEEITRIHKIEVEAGRLINEPLRLSESSALNISRFYKDLSLSAEQFIVKRQSSGGHTIIAGYHWFTDWGRDTMIAMRGLVIAQNKKALAESIINTFLQYLDGGMLPNRFPDQGEEPEYNTIDATLWLLVVLHEYAEKFNDWKYIAYVFPKLTDIIESHIQGTRYNIHQTEEGLLFGGEGLSQLTWMDAKIGDHVVTPRQGCPVEVNALWYNALMIHNAFCSRLKIIPHYTALASTVKENFRKHFFNGEYLNDVVIPDEYTDDTFRPNQIYALSLPFALVDKKEGTRILKLIEEKLLTSLGLRSLDPDHADYIDTYGGDQWHRDNAYHQGTVWAFLIGEYWTAYLRLHDFSEASKAEVLSMMNPLASHFYEEDCILGISEIFDGTNPQAGRGCVQQAWSVGMILKVLTDILTKKVPVKSASKRSAKLKA